MCRTPKPLPSPTGLPLGTPPYAQQEQQQEQEQDNTFWGQPEFANTAQQRKGRRMKDEGWDAGSDRQPINQSQKDPKK